jgi:hypothetical protein
MTRKVSWQIAIVVLIACAVGAYLLFIDRQVTRTYQAYVALDGKGPPDLIGAPWDGPDGVVLYRNGRHRVVCFDGFHSKELHDRLSPEVGQPVTVEYDTFNDFGKVRGYNVRSVDGFQLASGYHVFKPEFAASAGSVGNSVSSDDCW